MALFSFASCRKTDTDVFFKISNGPGYKFSDIELYDTSTDILYFKNVHNELNNIEEGSFSFLDNGEIIYSGTFWSAYSSLGPTGPFISAPPSMFGNYALRIGNFHFDKPDVRKDPRMIAVLNQHDLLHSGLALSSVSLEITGGQITFNFNVTNHDQSDLMIIDLDKTGANLFHYFTNGLYIRDLTYNQVFKSNIQIQAPDPWNKLDMAWLSQLKSGDSRQFTINYTINNPISPGEYYATFSFPGLAYQVSRDQLYQETGRIWLGDIQVNKRITIQ